METIRLSKILGKCSKETIVSLAEPIMQRYPVTVIRKPSKTLVMVRMQETVAKAEFYLGEMLACEALVELEGKKDLRLWRVMIRKKSFALPYWMQYVKRTCLREQKCWKHSRPRNR